MSWRWLQALVFVAGLAVGGRGCLPVAEICGAPTLEEIPTGVFPTTDENTGTIEIFDDRVELDLVHPTYGAVQATYARTGWVRRW